MPLLCAGEVSERMAVQLLDDSNRIIRTNEALAYLHGLVLAEPAITNLATGIAPDPQPWGASALHFSARLIETGQPVLLKVNVADEQLWWTRALVTTFPEQLPQVYATGGHLCDERLGWVLWERVRGGLHPAWQGREFDLLLEAGVRFQIAARTLADAAQAAGAINELDEQHLAEGLEQGVRRGAPGPASLVLARLPEQWAWVTATCETEICHGDLHMANALCRDLPPHGTALLIDYHPTRMPWACEPAKPEILNAEPARAGCRDLVMKQAAIRRRYGLSAPAQADLVRLQAIVLGWCAMQAWAYVGPDPDPAWRAPHVWHAENAAYIAAAAAV